MGWSNTRHAFLSFATSVVYLLDGYMGKDCYEDYVKAASSACHLSQFDFTGYQTYWMIDKRGMWFFKGARIY